MRSSPYKYIVGEPFKEKFDKIETTEVNSEGNLVASNGVFTAFPWKGAGGAICVHPAFQFGRFDAGGVARVINGHEGKVLDCAFNPFYDNVLATCAEDGFVKVWRLPADGLASSPTKEELPNMSISFAAHAKKSTLLKFHQ